MASYGLSDLTQTTDDIYIYMIFNIQLTFWMLQKESYNLFKKSTVTHLKMNNFQIFIFNDVMTLSLESYF